MTSSERETPADRFRRVAARFSHVAHQINGDGWNRATPCDGWIARDVIGHLIEWVPAVIGSAGIDFPPAPAVDHHPAALFDHLAHTLQAVLDNPDEASREAEFGPAGRMTVASTIDRLVLGDVFVHTWDLARSAGIDEGLDPDLAAEQLAGMEPLDDMLRASGHFGRRVPVSAAADVQTRLIAFTGRTP